MMASFCEFPQANLRLQPAPAPGDTVNEDGSVVRAGVKISEMLVFKDAQQMVSCWQFTADELLEVLRTGKAYLYMLGDRHPAVYVSGVDPWAVPIADFGVAEAMRAEEADLNAPDPEATPTADGAPPLPD